MFCPSQHRRTKKNRRAHDSGRISCPSAARIDWSLLQLFMPPVFWVWHQSRLLQCKWSGFSRRAWQSQMVEQVKGQLVNVKSWDMCASVEQVSVSSAAWLLDDFHERITGNGTVHKGILAFYVNGSILQEFFFEEGSKWRWLQCFFSCNIFSYLFQKSFAAEGLSFLIEFYCHPLSVGSSAPSRTFKASQGHWGQLTFSFLSPLREGWTPEFVAL